MKMREWILIAAAMTTGCAPTPPTTTEGSTGPLRIVGRTFDFHSTVRRSDGAEIEIYYDAYQELSVGSVVNFQYRCRDGASVWEASGVNSCSVTLTVVEKSPKDQKADAAAALAKQVVGQLSTSGYWDIRVTVLEDEDENAAFAHAKGKRACMAEWSGRKVGAKFSQTGLSCDGEIFVTE